MRLGRIPGPRFLLDHRFTAAHVSEYLDGELSAAGRQRIERHAAVCPKCHELIAKLRRTLAALAGLGAPQRQGLADRAIERLRRES